MTKSEAAAAQARCDELAPDLPWQGFPTATLAAALADREALIEAGKKIINAPYPSDSDDSMDGGMREYRLARIHMRALLQSLEEIE